MQVMIVVTHLLGTGHLSRALTLARAFSAAEHRVRLVSGGMPVAHLDHEGIGLVQLPALRSDGVDFARLLTPEGAVADDRYLDRRRLALTRTMLEFAPDVLVTELFPFGRRALASEFEHLLAEARALASRPAIVASVRDILAPPSKPAKAARTDDLVDRFYDAVLVHSDPTVTRLETSWPVSESLAKKLRYTGFVAPPPAPPHPQRLGTGEILVSAGGGAVGTALYACAIDAAKLTPGRRWRLLVGGSDARARIEALGPTPANLACEPARPDFRQMLRHASASVSMCGYNTALDLLQAETPSVLIPFDDGKEVEQTLRARSLSPLPGFEVLTSNDLTPERLCAALAAIQRSPRRDSRTLNFQGAARSVTITEEMARTRA